MFKPWRKVLCVLMLLSSAGAAWSDVPAGAGGAVEQASGPTPSPQAPMTGPVATQATAAVTLASPEGQPDGAAESVELGATERGNAQPLEQRLDRGLASWYGGKFHGRRTASGEPFDKHALTAAHRSLPLGTRVRVRSVHTGREIVVRINDRGPYKHQRIIDLSRAAMVALGTLGRGVTEVELLRE